MDLYLFRDERQTGPYTEADARALVAAGEIERTCLAWQEGMAEWSPLDQVLDLEAPPPAPAVPMGLPPVPSRTQPNPMPSRLPAAKQPSKPFKVADLLGLINVYGVGALVLVFLLLRLSGCHHD